MLRQVFLSFCVALVLFGVVLAVIYNGEEPVQDSSTALVVGLLLLAAVGLLVERRLEQPLRCEDDRSLADSYPTRFFLRVAFAEAAALFGFVGFFLTYAWWPYPVGVVITAVGLPVQPRRGGTWHGTRTSSPCSNADGHSSRRSVTSPPRVVRSVWAGPSRASWDRASRYRSTDVGPRPWAATATQAPPRRSLAPAVGLLVGVTQTRWGASEDVTSSRCCSDHGIDR